MRGGEEYQTEQRLCYPNHMRRHSHTLTHTLTLTLTLTLTHITLSHEVGARVYLEVLWVVDIAAPTHQLQPKHLPQPRRQ